ncbi:hypothetical protein [Streptomyces canus]|uniref:hypothetical protein n=1 Tax=Streptomyces canus TaxID=58343 RepID=UPI0027D8727A|nr:hypothetical protein [Streptomyces canus]
MPGRSASQAASKAPLANCPELTALAEHVRSLAHMLTHLQGDRLPEWSEAASATAELLSLRQFAQYLLRDLDAVTAGLTLAWNSGVVEGHVNRIKMLKRQMFGRAGFELLRKRVLLAWPSVTGPHEVDQSPSSSTEPPARRMGSQSTTASATGP